MDRVRNTVGGDAGDLAPVQVTDHEIDGDEAFEVIVGYAFADVPLAWRHARGFVGPPVEGTVPRWAYRNYDCVLADDTTDLTKHDILIANAINARMGGGVIAALEAVAGELGAQIARLDEEDTPFWELDAAKVLDVPADDDPVWALWRAWTIAEAMEGSGIAVTHKVLHHKRPRYFPLLDNETCKTLSDPKHPWSCIHRDLTTTPEGWAGLGAAFAKQAAERGTVELTRLRLHDILLWAKAVRQWDDCRTAGIEILGR